MREGLRLCRVDAERVACHDGELSRALTSQKGQSEGVSRNIPSCLGVYV